MFVVYTFLTVHHFYLFISDDVDALLFNGAANNILRRMAEMMTGVTTIRDFYNVARSVNNRRQGDTRTIGFARTCVDEIYRRMVTF